MKKNFLALLLVIPFFTGCDMLGELTKLPLPISHTITIPAAPTPESKTIETPTIETGLDSVLTEAGITTDFIENIKLTKMQFSISGSDDLSFLGSLDIYISSPGKDDIKIASASNVGNVTELTCTTQDVDIKSFIMGDSFKLKVDYTTDEALNAEKEIQIDMEFTLDLKVMGM